MEGNLCDGRSAGAAIPAAGREPRQGGAGEVGKNAQASCNCIQCRAACEFIPGWMTPAEARKAIAKGLAHRLMLCWHGGGGHKRIYVLSPAVAGYEGKIGPQAVMSGKEWKKGTCTFFGKQRCEIHGSGFKPLECRLALCCNVAIGRQADDAHAHAIPRAWDSWRGRRIIKRWWRMVERKGAA